MFGSGVLNPHTFQKENSDYDTGEAGREWNQVTFVRRLLLVALTIAGPIYANVVFRVDLDGVVHPVMTEMLQRVIEQAEQQKAELIVLRLNTPGGFMEASREMVTKMIASPVPLVCYVSPGGARAASAGFFLLLAGDVAAMAPSTRTGAASPVFLGREMDPAMRRKIESDSRAELRTLAERHGRDAEVAEKAVSDAKSFTEQEALAAKLIDLVAKDETDLLEQLDGRMIRRDGATIAKLSLKQAAVKVYKPTLRQQILQTVSDPNLAFVLLILGVLGLYLEFLSPGLILPGVLGSLLALLGLTALAVLPINWLGAALIVLALTLFILETQFTSHGILGVGGAVAMVFGALMLVDGPPEFRINLTTALGVGVPFAAIAVFLATLVIRARGRRVETGVSGMIGEAGTARTALTPSGKVFVHGEYWDATSTKQVAEGARVRVVAVEGLHLRVEPID